jgi:small subunit ribosomal protein S8
MTDPVADMLVRIRNGLVTNRKTVEFPKSKLKLEIVKILKDEGYIKSYEVDDTDIKGSITIKLKYYRDEPTISGFKKISKPGRRIYANRDEIPYIRDGLGTCILSTSKGILPDYKARKLGVGGELICAIW